VFCKAGVLVNLLSRMANPDILIVGAGAAGLMAAYTLSKAGKKVVVLEARDRVGGRIHTLREELFFKHAELGAEFVHGNQPLTMQLLHEAGIDYISGQGEMWQYRNGKLARSSWDMPGWNKLMQKLNDLKKDISIGEFLDKYFSEDQYTELRKSVIRFISGYDTADPAKASAFALRDEWRNENDDAQYRIVGGYSALTEYLAGESTLNDAEFHLNSVVKHIGHSDTTGQAILVNGAVYQAEKIIIALPLGVLQGGAITFKPAADEYQKAFQQMGFGAIVKLLLEFREAFWESEHRAHMSFVMSDEEIPTWWTQYPTHSTVLTGWLGGLPAEKRKHMTDEEFMYAAIRSLATIFDKKEEDLRNNLVTWKIANWTMDPFTLGSYVYDTVESHEARKILSRPIDNTIYFTGEFIYEGPAMGTVEAALTSGLEVAKKILQRLSQQ
jgi:monoamine oxidase